MKKSLGVVDKGWHDVWFGSAMSNCCPCRTFLAKQEQRRVPHSQVFLGVSESRLETFVFRLTFVSKPEKYLARTFVFGLKTKVLQKRWFDIAGTNVCNLSFGLPNKGLPATIGNQKKRYPNQLSKHVYVFLCKRKGIQRGKNVSVVDKGGS